MKTTDWDLFSAVCSLKDGRRKAAETMRKRIAEILATDEHAIALKPALTEQKAKALRLLTETPDPLLLLRPRRLSHSQA